MVFLVLALLVLSMQGPVVTAASLSINANIVLAYTNAERYRNDLPLLSSDTVLSQVAQRKMEDLFARQYFAHDAPTGEGVGDLAKDAGYTYIAVGENLALGDFTSSKRVVDAWMESPGHRENILSKSYTEIGIAAGRSTYKGKRTWIIVQSFGLPRSSCPTLNDALKQRIDRFQQSLDILYTVTKLREELLENKDVPRTVYRDRVESYNLAAEVYNERVEEYRALITQYNRGVDSLNACIQGSVDDR